MNCLTKGCLAVTRNAVKCGHDFLIWLSYMLGHFHVEVDSFGRQKWFQGGQSLCASLFNKGMI